MAKRYTQEYKDEAVRLIRRGDATVRSISRDLGVSVWTLRDWWHAAQTEDVKKKPKARAPSKPSENETDKERADRLERELRASQREVESLKKDRELLKKAAAFFARENE